MRRITFASTLLVLAALACGPFGGGDEGLSEENSIQTALAQTEAARPPTSTATDTPVPPTDTPTPTDTPMPTDTPEPTDETGASGGGGSGSGGGSGAGDTGSGASDDQCPPEEVAAWTAATTPMIQEMQADSAAIIADPSLLTNPIEGPALAARAIGRQAALGAMTPPSCLQAAQDQMAAAFAQNVGGFESVAGGDVETAAATIAASNSALAEATSMIDAVTSGPGG